VISHMNQSMPYASPRTTVRRQMLLTAVSLAAAGGLLAIPARGAQLVEVDEKPLAEAYRASKLIGASVVNDKDQKIGNVDDLIVTPTDRVLFAVISVGGFLGINGRLVAVPYSSLTVDDKGRKVVLPGASKDALSKLPAFHYA
jgi:sporulation protein YlmC with PRC-barrel domain